MAEENPQTYSKKVGYFNHISSGKGENEELAVSPHTYRLTPKYSDPFSDDAERKMAKFVINDKDVRRALQKGSESTLNLLNKLGDGRGYFKFFLQSAEESFDEKFQIMETLGDGYAVFGLGKKPRVFNYSGIFLNSVENDWRWDFKDLFENYLSISALSRAKGIKGKIANVATLIYDVFKVDGAVLNFRMSLASDNELISPFAFSFLATKITKNSPVSAESRGTTPESTATPDGTTQTEENVDNQIITSAAEIDTMGIT